MWAELQPWGCSLEQIAAVAEACCFEGIAAEAEWRSGVFHGPAHFAAGAAAAVVVVAEPFVAAERAYLLATLVLVVVGRTEVAA